MEQLQLLVQKFHEFFVLIHQKHQQLIQLRQFVLMVHLVAGSLEKKCLIKICRNLNCQEKLTPAIAFANNVFPQPGGPCNKNPLGGGIPICL